MFKSRMKGKVKEMPSVSKYTPCEMEVLKKAVVECGLNYVDVIRAAQTESGKTALLARANAGQLKELVSTTSTKSFFQRLTEGQKAVVHLEEGIGNQILKDDSLVHQTVVYHTPPSVYEKMKEKRRKESDGSVVAKYRSADISAIQLGVTSHLSGHGNQVAGVVLLDGNRATQEQAVLGVGVIPLYEASSHALFFPRLNINYMDPNFVERLQLMTVFSDGVLGNGAAAMSYSTMSIVRHNIVDAHYLPEPLPIAKIKERYPSGIKSLSNFEVVEVAPLQPAILTRSASYIPFGRKNPTTQVLDPGRASVSSQKLLPARASFSFEGTSYGTGCKHQDQSACPCLQHISKPHPSGPDDSLVPLSDSGTESQFLSPAGLVHPTDMKFVGSHPFTIPILTNVGTTCCSVPLSMDMLKDTEWGRFFRNYQYLKVRAMVKLVGSASIFTKGLLWLCYDPCGTLNQYPSRNRALTLQGEWFMPGRHDSVSLTIDDPATSGGTCDMTMAVNGYFKVVLIKQLENFETTDYGMELSAYLAVDYVGMKLAITGSPKNFLPLRHLVIDYDLSTTLTKGKAVIIPINPLLPSCDDAQFYPSCSSSILENHGYWKGELYVEIIFSMAAACGGNVEIGFSENDVNGAEGDTYRRFGSSVFDLRAHRICRVSCPMVSAGGMCQAGSGSILGVTADSMFQNTLRLVVLFTAPPQLYDDTKSGSMLIRYLGISNWEFKEPIVSFNRMREKPASLPNCISSGPRLVHGTGEWSEPAGCCVPFGLQQEFFRLFTITSWPKGGSIFFPAVPMGWLPVLEEPFHGEINKNNGMVHRSQENAQWRGTMEYYCSVRYQGGKARNPVSMVSGVVYNAFEVPCLIQKYDDGFVPVLGPSNIFDIDTSRPFASVTTPPGRWYFTHWFGQSNYTLRTCPRWVILQFPDDLSAELNVKDITVWAKPSVEFAHPVGGFPITVQENKPVYYRERSFPVS